MYNFSDKGINKLITATSNLSKGLEDLAHIKEKGIESWNEKYKISKSYDNARKFISLTEINKMSTKVERIYKVFFGGDWKEKLNEKTN